MTLPVTHVIVFIVECAIERFLKFSVCTGAWLLNVLWQLDIQCARFSTVISPCHQMVHNIADMCSQSGCGSWFINPRFKVITQRRSTGNTVGCFQQRLFVRLFVNTITSERINIGWWNLGVGALYKNLVRVWIWGSGPLGALHTPQKFGVRLWRWEKNSAGCLVYKFWCWQRLIPS